MKKNVLFAVRNMNIGGVEKSLLSLLNSMNPSDYDVDVLLLENNGGFLSEIPEWVRVIVADEYQCVRDAVNNPPLEVIRAILKRGHFCRAFGLLIGYFFYKIRKDITLYYKYVFKKFKVDGLKSEYDCAVIYTSIITYLSYIVLNFVIAKEYIGWIHFDFNRMNYEINSTKKLHERMRKIFVVSKSGMNAFCDAFPCLSEKCFVRYNTINKKDIIEKSKVSIDLSTSEDYLTIVTVSRLSREKGIDLIVESAGELLNNGIKFKWYIVGGGKEYGLVFSRLAEEGLLENVFLLGEIENPLPYIRCADIYVQPSRTEGYCTTSNEAKALGKPIVVTDVSGMREQFIDGETAYIVPVEDSHAIFVAVKRLCLSEDERKRLADNIIKYGFVEDQYDIDSIFE